MTTLVVYTGNAETRLNRLARAWWLATRAGDTDRAMSLLQGMERLERAYKPADWVVGLSR